MDAQLSGTLLYVRLCFYDDGERKSEDGMLRSSFQLEHKSQWTSAGLMTSAVECTFEGSCILILIKMNPLRTNTHSFRNTLWLGELTRFFVWHHMTCPHPVYEVTKPAV
jgi:hypothetical protein